MEIALVLGLLVLAVTLFATERISVDVVTLLLLVVLVVCGVLEPAEAFQGFASEIVVMLGSIFVISGALQRTGVLDAIGRPLQRVATRSGNRLLLAAMTIVSGVSAFMNNTTVTSIFLPPVMGVARQANISASRLLMPVAFASILGGTCTLIGTSTNIAVSGYIARAGMKPIGMFEITPIGLVIVVVGIAYMMLIGRRMLPDHGEESLAENYAIREYLSEIVVTAGSHLIGQRIFDSDLAKMDFRILEVIRGARKFLPEEHTTIEAGDLMLVEGKVEDLMKVKKAAGIEIRAELKGDVDLQSEDIRIVEVLITPQSNLIGRTLKEAHFRIRYRMTALAIYRHGQSLRDKIGRITLRLGDVLLVQGPADRLGDLRREPDFMMLSEYTPRVYRKYKGLYTIAFFVAAIGLGTAGVVPMSIAFLGAAVLVLIAGCISIDEAHEFIDWRLLILIGGMTAFGTAMDEQHTGAAGFLARAIVDALNPVASLLPGDWGVKLVLLGFILLTVALTQPMSNAAAALVVLPVALEAAHTLGANARSFAIAIMLSASVSFIAPFEPSCILVYGPGKYRVMDFLRIGSGLTLVLVLLVLVLLPVWWPLG